MELHEQRNRPTLAQKLGDVTHMSPLLRKVQELSGCAQEEVAEWLLKCAVERGATHYRHDFNQHLPPDNGALTNEELGIALCLAHHDFSPTLIRAAAQLLSTPDTNAKRLTQLATMERCEPVLLHIAEAAARVAPKQEPWSFLRAHLVSRHRVFTGALPHWSRFVLQTGYTPAGRGPHTEWLIRNE